MDHIHTNRLAEVAVAVETIFDRDEMNHLRVCRACLTEFTQLVLDNLGRWDTYFPDLCSN